VTELATPRYGDSFFSGIVMEAPHKGQRMVVAPLVAFWKGDVPLGQAFWEYAIVYGTIANIVATAAAIAAVAAGLPDAVGVGLFLIPVPYIVTAVVGVARSANRYQGPPMWAGLAKVAVFVWGAVMIFI
jgi:hypothetical protein